MTISRISFFVHILGVRVQTRIDGHGAGVIGVVVAIAVAHVPASKHMRLTEAMIPKSTAFPVVTVKLIDHPINGVLLDPEDDDALEDFEAEPEDASPVGLPETVPDVDMAAGSSNDEGAGDLAEVFHLPKITGEEDEEMVESGLFQPEARVIHVDDAPTAEDNKANEEGIVDFFACMNEFRIQT